MFPLHTVTLVPVPVFQMTVEDQELLSDMGATEIPFVNDKVPPSYILVVVTVKTFQGSERASVKVALPQWRKQNEPRGKKAFSLQGTGLFALSSSVKSTLPR